MLSKVMLVVPWVVVAGLFATIGFGLHFGHKALKSKDKLLESAQRQAAEADAASQKAELAAQAVMLREKAKDDALVAAEHQVAAAQTAARRADLAAQAAAADAKAKDEALNTAKRQLAEAQTAASKAESASRAPAVVAKESNSQQGKPGPWGQMGFRPITIGLPDEYVFVPPADRPPVRWFFHGYSRKEAVDFLKSAGITPAQRALIEKAEWKSEPDGAAVEPGDEFILSLSSTSRAKIYTELIEFEENSRQVDPVWFQTGHVNEHLKDSGLASSSLDLLKGLLYPQGTSLSLFADFLPALRRLPDDRERRLLMNAVSRKRTLLADLHVTANSNLEAIIDYWSIGGRKKDIAPLLQSLRREGDAHVNIVCLIPPFARERLYTYPLASDTDTANVKQDTFWTAMNFFSEHPDNRVNDMNYLRELLKTDYTPINQPTQLGDVLFLATTRTP